MPERIPVEFTLIEHFKLMRPHLFRDPDIGLVAYAAGFYGDVPLGVTCYGGDGSPSYSFECAERLGEPGMRRVRRALKEAEPHTVTDIPGDVDEASIELQRILRESCPRIYPGKEAPSARARGALFYPEVQHWHIPRHLPVDAFLAWVEKPALPEDAPRLEEVKYRTGQGYVAVADPAEMFERHPGARVLIDGAWRDALFNSTGRAFETTGGQRAYHQFELI